MSDPLMTARSAAKKKRPPLGSGQRFRQLESKLASRPGVTNPAALAAYIGRKKYEASRFSALSHHKG
jgi:hypothetical protein